jgi:2-keto-3-deoxy-L-rhamnonate aldolase RhmA
MQVNVSILLLEIHPTVPTGDAQAAVGISKYPPQGTRSMTGQLPVFSLVRHPLETVIRETNETPSVVTLMIETAESIENVDEIARVPGVDVLLVGSNDLSIELGVPGQFESSKFRSALKKVSGAAKKHNKVFGLAGIYDRPDIQDRAINQLGVRYILGQQDSGILAKGANSCASVLAEL